MGTRLVSSYREVIFKAGDVQGWENEMAARGKAVTGGSADQCSGGRGGFSGCADSAAPMMWASAWKR